MPKVPNPSPRVAPEFPAPSHVQGFVYHEGIQKYLNELRVFATGIEDDKKASHGQDLEYRSSELPEIK